jgi:hypothetical protein
MANFGNAIMGFFSGGATGGGGASTGVNGLNGTTNIGLGGTLDGNTLIDANSLSFEMSNAFLVSFEGTSGGTSAKLSIKADVIQTTFNNGVLSAQEGFTFDYINRLYVFGGNDASITCDSINQRIIFATKFLGLDAITLNSGATTISVNTIPITINSTQYYILLAT